MEEVTFAWEAVGIVPFNPILLYVILNASLPPVSIENVSAAGNLIAVFKSPAWVILSAIEQSPVATKPPVISIP